MSRLLRKFAVCGLIAAYGTIALLGHAGLHAVGGHHHGHSHGLDYHTAAAPAEHHAHGDHSHGAHSHGGCHHHDHAPGEQSDQQPAGHEHPGHDHGPLHDDDNCSICQFFAAHGVVLTQGAPLHADVPAEPVLIPAAPRLPGAEQFQLPIRGPPAC